MAGPQPHLNQAFERAFADLRSRLEQEFRRAVAEGVETAIAGRRRVRWGALSPQDQEMHLRAQRFARVKVAEMQLYRSEALKEGRARRNIFAALRTEVDAARAAYREQFLTASPSMADYLDEEILRNLAYDDRANLGPDYPGPLA